MEAEEPRRFFVSGTCSHCGDWYLRIQEWGTEWTDGPSYCSDAHKRRAKKKRAKSRPAAPPGCPVPDCWREIYKKGAPVCGVCWHLAASMCLGKRRLTEAAAKEVEGRTGLAARWCRCCGWFHNTGHPAKDGDGLIERVGNVLVAMATAKGQPWVNDLIESWDPAVRDRKTWVQNRTTKFIHPGDA